MKPGASRRVVRFESPRPAVTGGQAVGGSEDGRDAVPAVAARAAAAAAPSSGGDLAELARQFATALHGLGRELRCSVCMSLFNDPMRTPCGHTFCRDCIMPWIAVQGGKAPCAMCKSIVTKRQLRAEETVAALVHHFRDLAPEATRSTLGLTTQFTQVRCALGSGITVPSVRATSAGPPFATAASRRAGARCVSAIRWVRGR